MATLQEVAAEREQKAGEIKVLWDKAIAAAIAKGKDGKEPEFDEAGLDEFRARSEELDALSKSFASLKTAEAATQKALEALAEANQPRDGFRYPAPGKESEILGIRESKSLGELFVETSEYRSVRGDGRPERFTGKQLSVEIEGVSLKQMMARLKTVMAETGTGFAPPNNRTDVVVLSAMRRPLVSDFIPTTDDSTLQVVKYMEETTFTNNAASAAEGAAMAESALGFTQQSVTVELAGTYLPVTEQQLSDVPSIRDLIDQRLMVMLALVEEGLLLGGTGTTPQITGFYNKAGIQSQAKGGDSTPDAVYKLFTLIRWTGFAEPSVMFWHPNDWQDVRLLKDTTGRYLWGDPSLVGPEQIWGVRVVQTTAATEGSPLAGDFPMYSHITRNQGAQINIGYVNTDFIKNQLTIKINSRFALEIYRPGAFGKVTGV